MLSSIRIVKTASAEDAFTSYTSTLSQDYRMVDGKLEELSHSTVLPKTSASLGTFR